MLVYLLYAAGDLLHFIFSDRYVGWARGCVCWGGGDGISSNSVCIANGWIYKAYTLQRYSDKKSAGQELSILTMSKGHT